MSRHLLVPALLAAALVSCSGGTPEDDARGDFDSIASAALDLYRELHPLRWSGLGLAGADSLLFTFTEREMAEAAEGLDSLIETLSSLPASSLDRQRLDDSFLLLDWMKGERFALGEHGACRSNPLLYCWMIEEALFSIPSRPGPPYPGEAGQYARRLGALPLLVESAALLLERPGVALLEEAVRRLDRVLEAIPALCDEARRRYGEPLPECAASAAPVRDLRAAFAALLEGRPRGRVIMGLEDLSLVMEYAEHLDVDPATLIAQAEGTLRRLGRRPQPADGILALPPADPDSLMSSIEKAVAARRVFGAARPRPALARVRPLYEPLRVPVDPYLTVPVIPRRPVRPEWPGPSTGNCIPVTVVPPGGDGDPDRLFYDLVLSCSAMTEPSRRACRAATALRTVFSSETYRYGWETLVVQELSPLFPARRAAMARIEGEQRVLALARMVVVFRLHTGIFTTEAARDYLTETAGLSGPALEAQVSAAAASPAAAFDGVAAVLLEQMKKTAGGRPGEAGRLRETLLENGMLPLALIEKKLPG